jgi:hypothetical protein
VPVWSGQYAAVTAVAVLAVGGAGAILTLHHAGGNPRDRADARSCGLVTYSVLRAVGHSDSHSGGAVAIGAPLSVQRLGSSSPPAPTPSATPAPASPAPGIAGSGRVTNTRAGGPRPGIAGPGRDHHILNA